MASRTTLIGLIAGVGAWLMIAATPIAAFAGGCNCTPPPPPPTPPTPTPCCAPTQNIVVPGVNVFVAPSVNVAVNASASASANSFGAAQTQSIIAGGGGGGGIIAPGPVTSVDLNVGGEERQAYTAMRSRYERVVIQAFCFDDKDVPHPASQVFPGRDVDETMEGEIYRCIAGTHMQVTIAPWRQPISFEGGQTLTCLKGEALYHTPGRGGGRIECRPQKPARDCNERSLLRRFGAGIKVMTLLYVEKYTAYREVSHGGSTMMTLDGGVGGVVY